MKNYIKPEFEVYSFDINTSIMEGEATPTPVAAATVNPMSANIQIKDASETSKKYYAEYNDSDKQNWDWKAQ